MIIGKTETISFWSGDIESIARHICDDNQVEGLHVVYEKKWLYFWEYSEYIEDRINFCLMCGERLRID